MTLLKKKRLKRIRHAELESSHLNYACCAVKPPSFTFTGVSASIYMPAIISICISKQPKEDLCVITVALRCTNLMNGHAHPKKAKQ